MQALLFSQHVDEKAVLTVILQQAGFTVRSLRDLESALQDWPEQPPELILITLPDGSPETLRQMREMRAFTVVPIVLIADLIAEETQVDLYEAGADLLIIRPYSIRVMLAQIRALLRRSAGVPFFSLPILDRAGVSLDPATRSVKVAERPAQHLTQLEFRLLYTLMTHVGQVLPAENIVEHVWGYSGEGNRDLVRGLVQRLRSKVEVEPRQPKFILTEPGLGYYFSREEQD